MDSDRRGDPDDDDGDADEPRITIVSLLPAWLVEAPAPPGLLSCEPTGRPATLLQRPGRRFYLVTTSVRGMPVHDPATVSTISGNDRAVGKASTQTSLAALKTAGKVPR